MERINLEGDDLILFFSKTRMQTSQGKACSAPCVVQTFSGLLWVITGQQSVDIENTLPG